MFLLEQGMEAKSILRNFGIVILILGGIVLLFALYFLLKACAKKYVCCGKIKGYVKNQLCYSMPLRYIILGYLTTTLVLLVFLCVTIKEGDTYFLLALYTACVLMLLFWPFETIKILFKHKDDLEEGDFKRKYHTLYDGIKTDSMQSLLYYAIFATRRFDLVLISIVLAKDSPLNNLERSHYDKKIFLFLYLQILYLAYVHTVWPHSDRLFNYLEVFNEYVLTLLGYFMIMFCSSRNIVDL